jgi:hypothetical protein
MLLRLHVSATVRFIKRLLSYFYLSYIEACGGITAFNDQTVYTGQCYIDHQRYIQQRRMKTVHQYRNHKFLL